MAITTSGLSGTANSQNLRPPQPGDDIRKNWLTLAQAAGATNNLRAGIAHLRAMVQAQKHIARFLIHLFPFKIYQLPSVLRVNPDPSTDWRKFRVRAGKYNEIDVAGTDGYNVNPDAELLFEDDMVDIVVPENTLQHYFWIDATDANHPILKNGAIPQSQGWTNFPAQDTGNILIGTVNTQTNSATNTPIIRQLVRADLQPQSSTLQCFHIKQIFSDYIQCSMWDGNNETGSFLVAKHQRFRRSLIYEVIDGDRFQYTYTHPTDPDNNRISSIVGQSYTQTECAYPRYAVGPTTIGTIGAFPEIWAMKTNFTGVPGADWLEISPQRVWLRRWNQQS